MSKPMTVEEFRSLSRRDFDNGAVRDEIYAAIKQLATIKAAIAKLRDAVEHYSPHMEHDECACNILADLNCICREHGVDCDG